MAGFSKLVNYYSFKYKSLRIVDGYGKRVSIVVGKRDIKQREAEW